MEHKKETLPLLSIVIATRNRVPYAISAIQSILEIPDPRLELVVQDNSDLRDLESYVNINIRDIRLRYQYTPPPFSMIDNFNAAVEMATGEYVCLIGDDDGINPEILEATEWAKANDLEALTPINLPHYLWRNSDILPTLFTKGGGATLSILAFSSKFFMADVHREVIKFLHNGGVDYQHFHLPKLYYGIVRQSCLENIHSKIGTYFQGLSPDIFSVLAISEIAKRVIFIDYPLTIPGVCPGSGSTYDKKKIYNRRLEDAFLFRDRGEYHWCELVPRVFSAETIWIDSGIAALRAMGRNDLVQELNLPKLAAYCIGANRGVTGSVLRDLFMGLRIMGKNQPIGAIQFAWSLITGPGVKFARRAWNRFLMIIGMRAIYKIDGLENMVEVSHALTRYLKENGHSISDIVRRRAKRL